MLSLAQMLCECSLTAPVHAGAESGFGQNVDHEVREYRVRADGVAVCGHSTHVNLKFWTFGWVTLA